jgi:hypothetical protein
VQSRLRTLRDERATVFFRHTDVTVDDYGRSTVTEQPCAAWQFRDYVGGNDDNRWEEVVLRKEGVKDGRVEQYRVDMGGAEVVLLGPYSIYVGGELCSEPDAVTGLLACHTPGDRHVNCGQTMLPVRESQQALYFQRSVWFTSRAACEAQHKDLPERLAHGGC